MVQGLRQAAKRHLHGRAGPLHMDDYELVALWPGNRL